ncbi:tripartite tricarboxylate transporter TctB family protein [Xanthobacter sp. V4C-4]|uniref:tripartite tricarboxylate transporter TctB family protein n=1 Tax=Xanthobacter cornucopiae TaxID=3119924 RepID=UPI00372A3D2D
MRIASRTNFLAGLLFAGFGAAALLLGRDYVAGTAAHMGPGYFPRALGIVLVLLGGAIALKSLAVEGPALKPVRLRPLVVITLAIVLFAVLLERVGLVASAVVLVAACRLAGSRLSVRETVLLAVGLAGASALLFGYGLGIPLPIWPPLT